MLDGKHVILVIEVEDIMGATAETLRDAFVDGVCMHDYEALVRLRAMIVDENVSTFEDVTPNRHEVEGP